MSLKEAGLVNDTEVVVEELEPPPPEYCEQVDMDEQASLFGVPFFFVHSVFVL